MLTQVQLCGLQQGVVVNYTVRSTLDNDIYDSRCDQFMRRENKKYNDSNQDQGLAISPIWASDILATWTRYYTYQAVTRPAFQHLVCMDTVIFISFFTYQLTFFSPSLPIGINLNFFFFFSFTWWIPSYWAGVETLSKFYIKNCREKSPIILW